MKQVKKLQLSLIATRYFYILLTISACYLLTACGNSHDDITPTVIPSTTSNTTDLIAGDQVVLTFELEGYFSTDNSSTVSVSTTANVSYQGGNTCLLSNSHRTCTVTAEIASGNTAGSHHFTVTAANAELASNSIPFTIAKTVTVAFENGSDAINAGNGNVLTFTLNGENAQGQTAHALKADSPITLTVATDAPVSFFSDNTPAYSCTINIGESACKIGFSADVLAITGDYQMTVSTDNADVVINDPTLPFTIAPHLATFLYIAVPPATGDASTGGVYKCPLDNAGNVNACTIAGLEDDVAGAAGMDLSFQTVINPDSGTSTTYAYVEGGSTASNQKCQLDTDTNSSTYGDLINCVDANLGPKYSITTIQTVNRVPYFYAASGTDTQSTIFQCTISQLPGEEGNVEDCNTNSDGFNGPQAVLTYNIGDNRWVAYVSEWNTGNIYLCPVNADNGQIASQSECSPFSGINPGGAGLAIQKFNNTTYLYIMRPYAKEINRCEINASSGEPSNCESVEVASEGGYDLALASINNGSGNIVYAYTTDEFGAIHKCDVSSTNGSLSSCSEATEQPPQVDYSGIAVF